jgi:hypothetical protein
MRNAFLLSLLCLASCATTARADDLLQLVVIATGNQTDAALDAAAQDSAAFLTKFVGGEGSSYRKVNPGGSLPVVRNLRSSPEQSEHRELADLGCPNSCSNSGSTRCRSLGCAYCGECGGRLLQQMRTASQQRTIESDLQSQLDKYCEGKTGCKLHARIMRVDSDGTASRAN